MHGNDDHVEQRRAYVPDARDGEWRFRKGGQRVKIIKNTEDGGKLKMGAEIVASENKKTRRPHGVVRVEC
ncbi:malate:quinone oxidoreductase [Salipiger mangrovisoli]